MKKFQKDARVCFIGDSITANGTWIAHIFDYYRKNCPEMRVKLFNTGISGGYAVCALKHLEKNTLVYEPTAAVIMLGMNDINQGFYGREETPEIIEGKRCSIESYQAKMKELADILYGKGITLTFCTPTPYDGISEVEIKNNGVMPVLEECAEFVKKLAKEYQADVVDFNSKIKELIANTQQNKKSPIIGPDRIHPTNDIGHSVLARIFLRSQGFDDVEEPTPESILSGSVILHKSEKNQKRHKTETILRNIWNTEWILLNSIYEKSDEEKIEFAKKYPQTNSDVPAWYYSMAPDYIKYKKNQKELIQEVIEKTDRMYQ